MDPSNVGRVLSAFGAKRLPQFMKRYVPGGGFVYPKRNVTSHMNYNPVWRRTGGSTQFARRRAANIIRNFVRKAPAGKMKFKKVVARRRATAYKVLKRGKLSGIAHYIKKFV